MSIRQRPSRPSVRAFTIVELLVVISIIALLLAVVSVGIVQAGKTARQTKALSNLKQVATAWTQYANQNDDRALPGYMDESTQAAFKIKVRDRDGNRVDAVHCKTYPFRLLPFLEHDRSMMYDYLQDYEQTSLIPNSEIAANPAFGYNAFYLGGWWTTPPGQTEARVRACASRARATTRRPDSLCSGRRWWRARWRRFSGRATWSCSARVSRHSLAS
jgi:prepilin-type N-terminal cleavage/methylation domain-containing protein